MKKVNLVLREICLAMFLFIIIPGSLPSDIKAQIVFEPGNDISKEEKTGERIDFELEAGGWYPLGALRHTFESGVSVGGRMGIPVGYNVRLDVGVQFNTPSTADNILYETGDTVIVLNGARTYSFLFGTRAVHSTEIGEYFFLESIIGIGLGMITSNQPQFEAFPTFVDHYRIGTVQISAGSSIHRKIGKTNTIGFFADYNFAPYSLFGRVGKGFGHSYVRTGVSMRFIRSIPPGNGADDNGWYMPEDPKG